MEIGWSDVLGLEVFLYCFYYWWWIVQVDIDCVIVQYFGWYVLGYVILVWMSCCGVGYIGGEVEIGYVLCNVFQMFYQYQILIVGYIVDQVDWVLYILLYYFF